MNKKTYRLLLVALFMLFSAAMGAVSVNAASGFMSPMDGDEVLFGEPVEIQYVTGYASNRQTYCEFQVNDPDGNIVFKESYSYKNMYDVVDASFIPAAAGAYTIKAQIYYYMIRTPKVSVYALASL